MVHQFESASFASTARSRLSRSAIWRARLEVSPSAGTVSLTKTPSDGTEIVHPSSQRARMALLAVIGATPYCSASVRLEGICSLGFSSPDLILARISSATCWYGGFGDEEVIPFTINAADLCRHR